MLLDDVAWQIVTLSEGVAPTPGATMNAVTPRAPATLMAATTPHGVRFFARDADG